MANNSKHENTSDHSRLLCDLLRSCFPDTSIPRLASSPSVCGVHIEKRKAAVYWLYHSQEHVRIYFDCDETNEVRHGIEELLPEHVTLQARPFPRNGFALRTPLFLDLHSIEQARGMGQVLQLVSSYRMDQGSRNKKIAKVFLEPHSEASVAVTDGQEEGARVPVLVNRYERNKRNRELCIMAYGALCAVCGFDFSKVFGVIGQGYIHVHHLAPLASLKGKARKLDPIKDLRSVCPNCHEMLHTVDPPYTIDELKSIIAIAQGLDVRLRQLA
jgi:hypothetical protein